MTGDPKNISGTRLRGRWGKAGWGREVGHTSAPKKRRLTHDKLESFARETLWPLLPFSALSIPQTGSFLHRFAVMAVALPNTVLWNFFGIEHAGRQTVNNGTSLGTWAKVIPAASHDKKCSSGIISGVTPPSAWAKALWGCRPLRTAGKISGLVMIICAFSKLHKMG